MFTAEQQKTLDRARLLLAGASCDARGNLPVAMRKARTACALIEQLAKEMAA